MASQAATFLCPTCHAPLQVPDSGVLSVLCDRCRSEVDVAHLETLVGRPRFVAERCWTGVEVGGFTMGELLGAGGMGTVYRATNAAGERFAVKFLSPSLAAEPELVARFSREIGLQEELDHPAIVRVRARGEEEQIPWFAMDLVDGPTLSERLSQGVLSIDEARDVFSRLLLALEHAHGRGVVHRDLKPTNVLLAPDGARLVDFGIAHLEGSAAASKTQLTRTDAILGTFPYMSPEQRAGRRVDARSDLFSLGVMLYESLCGERPEGAFRPIHQRRAEIPARVDLLLNELMQPDPADRIASAAVARARLLSAFAQSRFRAVGPLVAAAASILLVVAIAVGAASSTPSRTMDVRHLPSASLPDTLASAPYTLPILLGAQTVVVPSASSEAVAVAELANMPRAAKSEAKAPAKPAAKARSKLGSWPTADQASNNANAMELDDAESASKGKDKEGGVARSGGKESADDFGAAQAESEKSPVPSQTTKGPRPNKKGSYPSDMK